MKLTLDKAYYEDRIETCERNIEEVKNGHYTESEKEVLLRIYRATIRRAKRELMSFSTEN